MYVHTAWTHIHVYMYSMYVYMCIYTYNVHVYTLYKYTNHNTFNDLPFPSLLPVPIRSTLPVFSSSLIPLLLIIRMLVPLSAPTSACRLVVVPFLITSSVSLMLRTLG